MLVCVSVHWFACLLCLLACFLLLLFCIVPVPNHPYHPLATSHYPCTATGIVTLCLMLAGRFIFKKWGWGVAAMVTPVTLLTTGIAFFSLSLFPAAFTPLTAALGTTPLMLAVMVGALQNIFSKGAKYSLFDPCKEMAYIPLDQVRTALYDMA